MGSRFNISVLVISAFVFFSFCATCALGVAGVVCEDLCKNKCAFAVSSTGDRCILDKQVRRTGEEKYVCKTSKIQANGLKNLIETNECIQACGLERTSLGISSDSLLESSFTGKLCSPQCYHNCPNIIDLYFNLAAGEGVFLPKLCEQRGENARRRMSEMKSSSFVAPGPDSGIDHLAGFMDAPSPAASFMDAPSPAEAPYYF